MDVFNKSVVWEENRSGKFVLMKQGYKVDKNDQVELTGDPAEVRLQRSYVPVKKGKENQEDDNEDGVTNQKGGPMKDRKKRKEAIDALVAGDSDWGEEDREVLKGLEDSQFDKIVASAEKTTPAPSQRTKANGDDDKDDEDKVKTHKKDDKSDEDKPVQKDLKALLKEADPALRETLEEGQRVLANKKKALITALTEDDDCPFTAEELQGKKVDELEKLVALAGVESDDGDDYSGRFNGGDDGEGEVEPLETPTINWGGKKQDEPVKKEA
jgi:hypothetical protein